MSTDTPLRLFCELTPDKQLAGHYQIEVARAYADDLTLTKVLDLTPEDAAAILNTDNARMAASFQALNQQIATERDASAAQVKDLQAAVLAAAGKAAIEPGDTANVAEARQG